MEGFFFNFVYLFSRGNDSTNVWLVCCSVDRRVRPEIPLCSECRDKISAALLLMYHTAHFFFFEI